MAGRPTKKTQNHENGDGGNNRPPKTRREQPTRTKHGRSASQRRPKRGTSAPTTRPGGRKTPPQPGRHKDRAQRRAARNRHNNAAAADREEHHDTTGHHEPEKRTKNATGTETPRTGQPQTANGEDHETDDGSNEPTMPTTSMSNHLPNYSRKTAPCQAKTPRKEPTAAGQGRQASDSPRAHDRPGAETHAKIFTRRREAATARPFLFFFFKFLKSRIESLVIVDT